MSIYSVSVESYRDATKWLTAFLPATAVITAVAVAGGPLAADLRTASDLADFLARHASIVWCGALVLVLVAVALSLAARVLSVEPTELEELLREKTRSARALESAIGAGILAPDFLTLESVLNAYDAVVARPADPDPTQPAPPPTPAVDEIARVRTALVTVHEWKVFSDTRSRFTWFLVAFGAAAGAVCAATLVTLWQTSAAAPVSDATAVVVTTSPEGAVALSRATGCTSPDTTSFFAIGGTWEVPVLAVSGNGCRAGAYWSPSEGQATVVPPHAVSR